MFTLRRLGKWTSPQRSKSVQVAVLGAIAATILGCAGDSPTGLTKTQRLGGPVVRWDLLAKPLPEIPLPNDIATRPDSTSPTGRRVNVSTIAPTLLERDTREKANKLDGFGNSMPLTVSFDAPLDIADILKRHRDNEDPADDAVFLINIDADSPEFGERIPLSLGGREFPLVLEKTDNYFQNDVHAHEMNLVYEIVQEDKNCNNALDPGEDRDGDGVLDHPNIVGLEWHEDTNCNGVLELGEDFDCDEKLDTNPTIVDGLHEDQNCNGALDFGEDLDCDGQLDVATALLEAASGDTNGNFVLDPGEIWECAPTVAPTQNLRRAREDAALADHLVDFWEAETNTLIVRPVLPLREHTTYAAVLTKRLVGLDGNPVESPFPYTTHASQKADLSKLPQTLSKLGLSKNDVAFAWSYTTGSVTYELEQIRRGLYGAGPFGWLAEQFPVESLVMDRLRDDDRADAYVAKADEFGPALTLLALAGDIGVNPPSELEYVSHVVVGSFASPNFLVDRQNVATTVYPADDDEVFDIDPLTGKAVVGTGRVTFWCAVPKTIPGQAEQPFPVQIYGHGYTSTKLELMSQIGRMARFGIASCALDAFGHGIGGEAGATIDFGGEIFTIGQLAYNFFHDIQLGNFVAAMLQGRERDLDNDGRGDSGGDFWTADTFHTRDVVRQSIVDHIQMIRILRAFDGKRLGAIDTDGDGFGNLFGDFDGDGRPDLGGNNVHYAAWGISLGGVLSGVLAGIEPALDAAAPCAGGAGLPDIAIRSRQGGVPEAVFMPIMGPFVVFNPVPDTNPVQTEIKFVLNDVNSQAHVVFATSDKIRPQDRVEIENVVNGEWAVGVVPQNRRFRLSVAADALTATQKRPLLGLLDPVEQAEQQESEAQVDRRLQSRAPVVPVVVDHVEEFGDRLTIRVYDGVTGNLKDTIDHFETDVEFQGAIHPKGSPLIALGRGFGFQRNTPEFRRFMGLASMILQSADPMGYAPRYFKNPISVVDYDPDVKPGVNVLVIPTVGDMNVPVNTGIHMAVAAGTVSVEQSDPRYDKSQLKLLADTFTNEAVERLWRYDFPIDMDLDNDCVYETTVRRMGVYDIDDLDEGLSEFHAPSPSKPLRATVASSNGKLLTPDEVCSEGAAKCGTMYTNKDGINAMRIPYEDYRGQHGIGSPNPCRKFDIDMYMHNLIAVFFYSGGTVLPDDVCLESDNCNYFPWNQ
ncbi:MAG: hypothetical protein HUU55_18875 [Myxococcales bacterium]|nr:hypothetical protein [Myxococcales bacterium]